MFFVNIIIERRQQNVSAKHSVLVFLSIHSQCTGQVDHQSEAKYCLPLLLFGVLPDVVLMELTEPLSPGFSSNRSFRSFPITCKISLYILSRSTSCCRMLSGSGGSTDSVADCWWASVIFRGDLEGRGLSWEAKSESSESLGCWLEWWELRSLSVFSVCSLTWRRCGAVGKAGHPKTKKRQHSIRFIYLFRQGSLISVTTAIPKELVCEQ